MALPYKVVSIGGSIVAGLVASKGLDALWKASTGKRPPDHPEHPDSSWAEVAVWVAASSAALAVAKLFAARQAAAYYRRSTGHLPPKLEPKPSKA